MRAAVLNEQPGKLEIEDLLVDNPGPNEVLIRVVGSGLCHSDLHFMEASYPTKVPCVAGHESAGVVEAVGSDVTYCKPGDHVVTCLSVFCGQCRLCLSGRPHLCLNKDAALRPAGAPPRLRKHDGTPVEQLIRLGGFAEMMLVHQNAVVVIDREMPLDRAALVGCGVLTGTGAVFRTARVEPGSRVCVIGAGGVGLAAVQGARIAGAGQIVVVDLSDSKLEVAKQFGATDIVNASTVENAVKAVKALTGGGVDYSFEAIGLKATADQSFQVLDVGGTATVIGMIPPSAMVEVRGVDLFNFEKKIQGSMMGSNQFRTDIPALIRMYMDGRLKLDEMVSARLGLDDVNDGYAAMKRGEVSRQVIVFD